MATITIEQFDEVCVYEGLLHSGGLGPCCAVAVHDPKRRTAWMIHHPNMDVDRPLAPFLKKVLRGYRKRDGLRVYVTGCSIDHIHEVTDDKCRQTRAYVEETLCTMFDASQLFIAWSGPRETTELVLDLDTGEVGREVDGEFQRFINNEPEDNTFYDSNGQPIN